MSIRSTLVKSLPKLLTHEKAIVSKKYKPYEYCGPMKMILPPQQTKYCKMTKKAIRGFDHHCLFLEKSIGHGTHHYFMLFMMTQGQFFIASDRDFIEFQYFSCKSILVCILPILHGLAASWNGASTCYFLLLWILFWFILDRNTTAFYFTPRNSIFSRQITSKESFRFQKNDFKRFSLWRENRKP